MAAPTPAQLSELQGLISKGKAEDALKKVEKALKEDPKDAQLRFVRAMALAESGRHADAVRAYQKLIEDRPELPGPRNNLAVLYAQKGQYDKARVTLEGLLRSHPIYGAAYDNLGDLHARLASQSYAKALQLGEGAPAPAAPTLMAVNDLGSAPPVSPAPVAATALAAVNVPIPSPAPAPAAAPVKPPVVPAPANPAPAATVAAAKPAAPTAVATAKPVAAPPEPAKSDRSSTAEATKQVREAVNRWASAWSRQDIDDYIAAYHPSFNGGKSRSAWIKDRKARILGKSKISVTVSGLSVQIEGDRADVQFRQRYRSDRLDADTKKKMRLVRVGNKWLIDRESTGS
jgi:tetratricopeptide (TPR) repeat protein